MIVDLQVLSDWMGVLTGLVAGIGAVTVPIHRYIKRQNAKLDQHADLLIKAEDVLRQYGDAIEESQQDRKKINNALRAIFQIHLDELCDRILERGEITDDEYTQSTVIHETYKGLGGNGALTAKFIRAVHLPRAGSKGRTYDNQLD